MAAVTAGGEPWRIAARALLAVALVLILIWLVR